MTSPRSAVSMRRRTESGLLHLSGAGHSELVAAGATSETVHRLDFDLRITPQHEGARHSEMAATALKRACGLIMAAGKPSQYEHRGQLECTHSVGGQPLSTDIHASNYDCSTASCNSLDVGLEVASASTFSQPNVHGIFATERPVAIAQIFGNWFQPAKQAEVEVVGGEHAVSGRQTLELVAAQTSHTEGSSASARSHQSQALQHALRQALQSAQPRQWQRGTDPFQPSEPWMHWRPAPSTPRLVHGRSRGPSRPPSDASPAGAPAMHVVAVPTALPATLLAAAAALAAAVAAAAPSASVSTAAAAALAAAIRQEILANSAGQDS